MDRKDFEWLRADVNRMVTAFRQIEKLDARILSNFGKSACKVYMLLQQIALRAENKEDFRNRIEKEIIRAKRQFKGALNADEIYLLEDYLKENFNALENAAELMKTRHA